MNHPLLQSLEGVLVSGQPCTIFFFAEYEDGEKTCYENIVELREIDGAKVLYDLVLEEPSEMQLDEIGGYKILSEKEKNFAIANSKKLLEFATNFFSDMSPRDIQNRISNYLLSYQQRAICVYFGIASHEEYDINLIFEKNLDKVRDQLKQELTLRCQLEKQKILKEMDDLSEEVDEETITNIKSHAEHIHAWLDEVVVNLKNLDSKRSLRELLDSWPVVFAPAPWEIYND